MVTKDFDKAGEALDFLRALALDSSREFYFRGHGDAGWRLESTYRRHKSAMNPSAMADLEEMIDHFIGSLITTGKGIPFEVTDRRSKMEYARHYGLPTPILDWSFSPYNALFFAFNGTRPEKGKRAAVYAIDMKGMADIMARLLTAQRDGKPGSDYINQYHDFSNTPDFETGYPFGLIKFMRNPASWNTRMIRQMGSFLYDTFNFNLTGFKDLEHLIEETKETPDDEGNVIPALCKVSLPLTEGPSVFNELDVAGMTGIRLLDDYEGAVADAKNAYNYNRKSGYFWNLAAS